MSRALPRDAFLRVRQFARGAVLTTNPATPNAGKNLMRDVSALAAWCVEVGLPLDPEVVLHPNTQNRYIEDGLRGASDHLRRTRRSNLRRVARAVAPQLQPTELEKYSRPPPKPPYTPHELAGLVHLAEHQRNREVRERLSALLALGFGAGLLGGEYQNVEKTHVFLRGTGIWVAVRGRRPRYVPVLEPFATRLAALSLTIPTQFLLGGDAKSDRRNAVHNLLKRVRGGRHLPLIEVGRLRSTWLCHELGAIGFDALLAAAGVEDTHTILALTGLLPRPDDERVERFLRGSM